MIANGVKNRIVAHENSTRCQIGRSPPPPPLHEIGNQLGILASHCVSVAGIVSFWDSYDRATSSRCDRIAAGESLLVWLAIVFSLMFHCRCFGVWPGSLAQKKVSICAFGTKIEIQLLRKRNLCNDHFNCDLLKRVAQVGRRIREQQKQ